VDAEEERASIDRIRKPSEESTRIGVLSGNQSDNDTCLNVLRSGFSDLGYREGQTHWLEIRWADGRGDK